MTDFQNILNYFFCKNASLILTVILKNCSNFLIKKVYNYSISVAFPKGEKLCLWALTVRVVAGVREGVY